MLKKIDKISEGEELIIGLLVLAMAFGFAAAPVFFILNVISLIVSLTLYLFVE